MTATTKAGRRRANPGHDASRPPSPRNFYRDAMSEAEQVELGEAQQVEGLDDEIAVLRVRLKRAVEERPEDLQLLVRGVDLLVKAVAARYRLSPKARRDLAENLAATLNSLGDQLLPAAD
ncbi:MAG: hypothetical protein HYY03_07850 [Chloroflexi bacterium]|nr:hypothetical protein [Chloroflexota bacterium]